MIETGRRSFLAGLGALFAAPAIVRADALMKIKGKPLKCGYFHRVLCDYEIMSDRLILRIDKATHRLPMPRLLPGLQPPPQIADLLVRMYDGQIGDVEPGGQRYLMMPVPQGPHGDPYSDFNYPNWNKLVGFT